MRNSIHLTFLIIFQRVNVGGMVAWWYNCPSQKWQQRRSQVGACVPLDTVLQMKWLLRVMVSLRASTQFTPATSNAHAPLRDEEPNGRKLAHTIKCTYASLLRSFSHPLYIKKTDVMICVQLGLYCWWTRITHLPLFVFV